VEGRKLIGTVSDVLLDVASGCVVALVVNSGEWRLERVLPYESVQTVGRDTIVTTSAVNVLEPSAWNARGVHTTRATRLRNRRVITQGGRDIGAVVDLYVSPTGKIDGYDVSTPAFAGIIARRARLPHAPDVAVGEDAIIITETAAGSLVIT
jgi:uncharacterized protein YrrD